MACLLFVQAATFAQNPYRWTDELELLKSIDRLPEYRTGSYVESFSSYDRKHGNDDGGDWCLPKCKDLVLSTAFGHQHLTTTCFTSTSMVRKSRV